MSEITGRAESAGITVETYPGGAMQSLTLSPRAMSQSPQALANSIVAAVAEATAVANQRTKSALREALTDLSPEELAVLGLHQEATLTERAEATTPDTWRATP